ncbi:transcriptional regulator [Roseovarius sp. A46]|uniref:helix-turn-helix domain-containing protein n=1 Tax=Roseovarius sp. A46 TaxID=2109331 RepID=UPI001013B4A7|nr:helix-turn-helix transcriptional regulator [Roseovarius sp. A46]RXV59885.1 transcriptional regulator [Roseovarius sp. A46]
MSNTSPVTTLRYDEIGQRLRAFRLGSGLSADEIGQRIGISRTAVYRFEKGEVVKIETLLSLAELLGVSLPSLLGVEIEYISSAVTYFERLRQLEETADRIIVLAGPISYLLASDRFCGFLQELLRESVAGETHDRDRLYRDVDRIMEILEERKNAYLERRPSIINLISAIDMERLLRSGLVGRTLVAEAELDKRRELAVQEVEHFASLMEAEPIGVQIGLVTGTLPRTGLQVFRSGDRKTLSISPFRLGEQPNIRLGVAMITETQEALRLHETIIDEMWDGALKGDVAARYLRDLIAAVEARDAS